MIDPRFLHLLFSTASIERWNDQIRPVDFVELDKQAHKMIAAWLLGRIEEEENGVAIDWEKLVGFGIVEFAYRAVVTDLKPPVFHHLLKHKKRELDAYVADALKGYADDAFMTLFGEYTRSDENMIERRILGAAHFLASRWEFEIIYDFHPGAYGVREIKEKIDSEVEEYLELTGVRRLEMAKIAGTFWNFARCCASRNGGPRPPGFPRPRYWGTCSSSRSWRGCSAANTAPLPASVTTTFSPRSFTTLPKR